MAAIDKWLFNQRPDISKNLSIVKEKVQFLHISQDPSIKEMFPRISWRQSGKEDRTVPRICGSPNLRGCILGHTIVRSNILTNISFVKDKWVDAKAPTYYIYEIEGLDFLQPTKTLIPEVKESEEIWIVPYGPDAIRVTPTKIGRFIPYLLTDEFNQGKRTKHNTFYLSCDKDIQVGKNLVAKTGKWSFSMDGELDPFEKCYPIKDLVEITPAQWALANKTIKSNY